LKRDDVKSEKVYGRTRMCCERRGFIQPPVDFM
jgi:hypothetical protein